MRTKTPAPNNSIFKLDAEPPAPKVREAQTGHILYPIPTPNVRPYFCTVIVEYEGMSDDHRIELEFLIEGLAINPVIESRWGSSKDGFITFTIPESTLSFAIDSNVEVFYSVTHRLLTVTSLKLELSVQKILDLHLPLPELPQADDRILDLRTFSGGAVCHFPPMPYQKEGQVIWCRAEGLDHEQKPFSIYLLQGHVITENEVNDGIDVVIDRDKLHLCEDYSGLTILSEISYRGINDQNLATELRRDTWQIRQLQWSRVVYENFEGVERRLMLAGQHMQAGEIKIEFLEGSGQAGIYTFGTIPGMREGNIITLCFNAHIQSPPQRLRLNFNDPVVRVKFAFTSLHRDSTIYCYDASNNELSHHSVLGEYNGGPLHSWIDLTAPGESTISYIEVIVHDYSFFDFFTMWIK